MRLQDRVMEETKDRKNAVEAYVYEMRNKLSEGPLEAYATPETRENFLALLQVSRPTFHFRASSSADLFSKTCNS